MQKGSHHLTPRKNPRIFQRKKNKPQGQRAQRLLSDLQGHRSFLIMHTPSPDFGQSVIKEEVGERPVTSQFIMRRSSGYCEETAWWGVISQFKNSNCTFTHDQQTNFTWTFSSNGCSGFTWPSYTSGKYLGSSATLFKRDHTQYLSWIQKCLLFLPTSEPLKSSEMYVYDQNVEKTPNKSTLILKLWNTY